MKSRQGGFLLVEALVAAAIASVIVGSLVVFQMRSIDFLQTSSAMGLLREKAARASAAIEAEMRWAEVGTFLLTEENGSSRADFRVPVDYAAGSTVWSSVITYRVEPSAIDADRNGVLDEGRLVRIQDGSTRVVTHYVPTGGFVLNQVGGTVQLALGLAKADDEAGRLLQVQVEASVTCRNDS